MGRKIAKNEFISKCKRMSQLYDACMLSMSDFRSNLKHSARIRQKGVSKHITSSHGFVQTHHIETLSLQLRNRFPFELRALLLVRLVSDFELFLVRLIRETAIRSGLLFKDKDHFSWPRGKLTAFETIESLKVDLLDSDCRALTSGGFDEVCKFYRTNLGIDVNDCGVPISILKEIHARRHIHVHRGGLADAQYIREFDQSIKPNTPLMVGEDYLKNAIIKFQKVANHLDMKCQEKYPEPQKTIINGRFGSDLGNMVIMQFRGTFKSRTCANSFFDTKRHLRDSLGIETRFRVGNFLMMAEVEKNRARWSIASRPKYIHYYYIDIRFHVESGALIVTQQDRLTPKISKKGKAGSSFSVESEEEP